MESVTLFTANKSLQDILTELVKMDNAGIDSVHLAVDAYDIGITMDIIAAQLQIRDAIAKGDL